MRIVSSAARRAAPLVNRGRNVARRGGPLACSLSRPAFLATVDVDAEVLEIGPFDRPILTGPKIRYFDVLDTAGLRERAGRIGRSPASIPEIHYHSPTGDLSVIDRRFDAVVSSHAIEHQPDLIRHLNDVAAILHPGGRYYVIAPDKRFCFDHFLPLSSTGDVVAAHAARRQVHTREAVLAHELGTTHNDSVRHWLGMHGPKPSPSPGSRATAEADAARADAGEYVDVHAWIFSPSRFREVITDLGHRELVGLDLLTVHDTAFPQLEFFAVLQKRAEAATSSADAVSG